MLTDDILFASVRELSKLVRSKKISSTELTKAYLDRLEKYGAKLGAVATITADLALQQAAQADKEIRAGKYRGLLHGIPYGVKDLCATKGIPTTWGAAPYKNQVFDYDATVVKKLRDAGAVLVAKLQMVELAGGMGYNSADASFTGPTRTPWNLEYWSGGSSSGPGAAVAAALVPFAIGSETSGSILTPCAFSGISGLRPTYGLVSRYGAMALCWTLDKLGPMCRTADDCGIVLEAIAGYDPNDDSSVNKSFRYVGPRPAKRRYKVGVIKGTYERVQPEVKANFEASIEKLRSFCDLTMDVEFPDYPWGQIVGTIVSAEGASAFLDLIESGKLAELQNPNDRWGGYSGMMVFAVDYLHAMRVRKIARKAMLDWLAKFDAVIAPTRSTVAYPINVNFNQAYPGIQSGPSVIGGTNAAGVPAVCVPNGFGQFNLPTSIQFVGKPFDESTLLAIANRYQAETDWHTKRPTAYL